jgi:hypothetical protein
LPEIDLQDIAEKVREIQSRIAARDEKAVLAALDTETLVKLRNSISDELSQRYCGRIL